MKAMRGRIALQSTSCKIHRERVLSFALAFGVPTACPPVRGRPHVAFVRRRPEGEKFTGADLDRIKAEVEKHLENLWKWLRTGAESRVRAESNAVGK